MIIMISGSYVLTRTAPTICNQHENLRFTVSYLCKNNKPAKLKWFLDITKKLFINQALFTHGNVEGQGQNKKKIPKLT